MSKLPQGWLDFLREQHPIGSRVQVKEMADSQSTIQPGPMVSTFSKERQTESAGIFFKTI